MSRSDFSRDGGRDFSRGEWIFFTLCAAAYVIARGPAALVGPFILPFENAFQEAIALHHLGHVFDNRFLPVFARIDGVNFYHTAHPPLLHLFYAGLYSIFGTGEWVTRAAALALYLASVALWRRTGADADQPGWPLFPLALFLPVPFVLATTTNYEPLSIFFVSLIFYLAEKRKDAGLEACGTKRVCERREERALIPLLVALVLGMLTDWPVYLAVPALLIRHWRQPSRRNLYLGLIAFEAVFLAALLGYMYLVAGEVALFGHAAQRANPVGLFSPALWQELGSHWLEMSGAAATIIAAAAVLAVFRRSFTKAGDGSPRPASAFELFALFTVLLVLAAPQLVSRHHVYLLYFAPPVALALKDLVLRVDQKKLAVLALVVLFAAPNYIVRYQRNPAYWAMAERVKDKGIKTAFASAAIGAWYYYAGIETVFPMSVAAAKFNESFKTDLIHLDAASGEVRPFLLLDSGLTSEWAFPGERVAIKPGIIPQYLEYRDYLPGMFISGMNINPDGTEKPYNEADWGYFEPPSVNFILQNGKAYYGFRQIMIKVPKTDDQMIIGKGTTRLQPAIIHSIPRVNSDGVQFLAWDREKLAYSRFVQDGIYPEKQVVTANNIQVAILPGPRDNSAFDDAWWLEPLWEPMDGGSVE